MAPILRMQLSLDAYFTLEAQGVDDARREETAKEVLDSLEDAIAGASMLRERGDIESAATLEKAIDSSRDLLRQRDYAINSGRYEFASLKTHPTPHSASLRDIARGNQYIPEGTTSRELVRVATMLAEMDLNGVRPITVAGLQSLGWGEEKIGRSGRVTYEAPSYATLSSGNALGKGLRIFKQYLMKHGFASGIDIERAELTPRTAAVLIENYKQYTALQNVSDLESKEMVLGAITSPVAMIYHGARDTFSWLDDVNGAITPIGLLSLSAVDKIEYMRDSYGATNPALLQLARSIRDDGANNILDHLIQNYEASGRGRQMEAVVGGITIVLPIGYLGLVKLPAAAIARAQEISALVRAGKLTRVMAAAKLSGSLVAAGIRGIYEFQVGAARDVVVLTKEGGVVFIRLTGNAAKKSWTVLEDTILKAVNSAQNRINRYTQRLNEILARIPRYRLGWREVTVKNPATTIATPGNININDDLVIKVPYIYAMATNGGDGNLPARLASGGGRSAAGGLRSKVAQNVRAAMQKEAASGIERQATMRAVAGGRGRKVVMYVDLNTGEVTTEEAARRMGDSIKLEFRLDAGANRMTFGPNMVRDLRMLARGENSPLHQQVLEGLADVAESGSIIDDSAAGARQHLIGDEHTPGVEILAPVPREIINGNMTHLRTIGTGPMTIGWTGRDVLTGTAFTKRAVIFMGPDGRIQGSQFANHTSPRGTHYEAGIGAGEKVQVHLGPNNEMLFYAEIDRLNPRQREVIAEMARAHDAARRSFEKQHPYAISSLKNEGMGPIADEIIGAMLRTLDNGENSKFALIREGSSYRITYDTREFGRGVEVTIALVRNPDHIGGYFVQFATNTQDPGIRDALTHVANSWNHPSSIVDLQFRNRFSRDRYRK